MVLAKAPVPLVGDDTGAWGGRSVEGLNMIWVHEYTEKFSVIGYRSKDYLLTVNWYPSQGMIQDLKLVRETDATLCSCIHG